MLEVIKELVLPRVDIHPRVCPGTGLPPVPCEGKLHSGNLSTALIKHASPTLDFSFRQGSTALSAVMRYN